MALRLKYVMRKLTGKENITLSEFQAMFGTEFSVCVTNLTTGLTEFFTPYTHPDMPVYLALRASSSIPLVFKPVKWKGQLYVDGGVTSNYPIWAFDGNNTPQMSNKFSPCMNNKTIGINFSNGQYDVPSAMRIKTPKLPKTRKSRNSNQMGVDDDSSIISIAESTRMKAIVDRRVSIRVRGENMIESYMGITFVQKNSGPKDPEIAARANPVPAPPQYKLDTYNNPDLRRYFGMSGLKGVLGASASAGYNALDRPKDIHRTILLNDPIVTGLEFDAARKPRVLLRTLRDGVRQCIAFFKANYILKQKISEFQMKKSLGVSYFSPTSVDDEKLDLSDLEILKEDLVMTGTIPATLLITEPRVKKRLAETGYLAFRLHVQLQDPHWLHPGTDPMEHMSQFMHFDIKPAPLTISRAASFAPFLPEPFVKVPKSPQLAPTRGSLSTNSSPVKTPSRLLATPQDDPPQIELTEHVSAEERSKSFEL